MIISYVRLDVTMYIDITFIISNVGLDGMSPSVERLAKLRRILPVSIYHKRE